MSEARRATSEPPPDSSSESATKALEEEIRVLEQRLRKGEEILRTQKEAGGDHEVLAYWETRWINMLRQYELKCDRLERQISQRRQPASPPPSSEPASLSPQRSTVVNR
jgi:hypothetical protein